MIDNKVRATERARLHFQGIDACNQIVLSSVLTQEDREELLAEIAAFAQIRLEQCLADPREAEPYVARAKEDEPETLCNKESQDDDLSFLD